MIPYRFSVRCEDMYHNRRMGQINAVKYSGDGYYILSGSNEGNVRIWKSNSSQLEKTMNARQRAAISTNQQLINKFQNTGEIWQILNSRHVPKKIRNKRARMRAHEQAELQRLEKRGERAQHLRKQVRPEEE